MDEGGIELLLSLPRSQKTSTSLSLVQVGITLVPSAFQKVVALPITMVSNFVGLALDHLRSPLDPARKNASVFLGNALLQPIILQVFDNLEGLVRLLAAVKASLLMLRNTNGHETPRQEKQASGHNLATAKCKSHLLRPLPLT